MTPLSVLLVCHSYPPVIGGSELEAQRVSAALVGRGYKVQVVCAGGDPMPALKNWLDPAGVPVRMYGARWPFGVRRDRAYALGVAGMLLTDDYDLVYFLMQGLHLLVGLPIARMRRKPILMKVGGSNVITAMSKMRSGRMELDWLRKWAYRVMILNDGMREEGLAEGFSNEQLYWMPNPVDTVEFAPASDARRRELRERFGLPAEAPVVLYLGRVAPEKSLENLVDAFARVLERAPQAVLAFVGDGPSRKGLEDQARALGLPADRVRFVGLVKPAEVPAWLQASDIYTLVSYNEGFPCALVEAMSVGLASVVSDIPANRQLVDEGLHGRLVPPGDAEGIAAGILALIDDAGGRARMGAAARRRVLDNYSLDKIADRYERLFHDAVAAGGQAS